MIKIMEKKDVVKQLNRVYYGMMAGAVLTAALMYYLIMKDVFSPIDPMSGLGQVIQSIIIFLAVVSIPLGLYLFSRKCKKIRAIEDETERLQAYLNAGRWRIIVVSYSMLTGIAGYYLLGGYQSMIWIAAVAAIAWYFTKPTERKIELELLPDDDRY
ncbi:MAG: hypothetical protein IJ621_06050 [Paludibacteraceae bacterium]|nr:hypothetical protein [Paludibacteraceae bacterium]